MVLLTTMLAGSLSCKKDENDPPAGALSSYWKGFYSDTLSTPDKGYGLLFRSNNSVRVYDMALTTDSAAATIGEGTYTLSSNILNFNYTNLFNTGLYNGTGTINSSGNILSGQITFTSTDTTTGNFTVTKQ